MRRLPSQCPVCDQPLSIAELRCQGCGTTLRGEFPLSHCPFCNLPPEQLKFLELFVRCRGNLRELERTLGLSYPTVRARLDSLRASLGYTAEESTDLAEQRREILEALEAGSVTPEEAIAQLEAL
jgi:hypothetical protein